VRPITSVAGEWRRPVGESRAARKGLVAAAAAVGPNSGCFGRGWGGGNPRRGAARCFRPGTAMRCEAKGKGSG
jgi:hypothetical protein